MIERMINFGATLSRLVPHPDGIGGYGYTILLAQTFPHNLDIFEGSALLLNMCPYPVVTNTYYSDL